MFRRISAKVLRMEAAALCHRSHWVPKSSRSNCSNCHRRFRLWAGKHHCRLCGEIVCGDCSTKRVLFQKKSVRTCDDCVHVYTQKLPENNPRFSTGEFLRSHMAPTASEDVDGKYGRHSLPLRLVSSRGYRRHQSLRTSTGSHRRMTIITSIKEEEVIASSKEMASMDYPTSFSWQTQLMSLVIATFVVSMACVLKLMMQA